jgi:hypothetical protein
MSPEECEENMMATAGVVTAGTAAAAAAKRDWRSFDIDLDDKWFWRSRQSVIRSHVSAVP